MEYIYLKQVDTYVEDWASDWKGMEEVGMALFFYIWITYLQL